MKLKELAVALTVGAMFYTPNAYAEGWALVTKNNTFDLRGQKYGDVSYTSLSLSTTDPSKPEVRFSCSKARGLKTTILFQPVNEGILDGGEKVRYKTKQQILAIEGRDPVRHAWSYFKEIRTMQTRREETARMLFNAAVSGLSFDIKEPSRDRITITLPPVDDAFRSFAQSCHITNGAGG